MRVASWGLVAALAASCTSALRRAPQDVASAAVQAGLASEQHPFAVDRTSPRIPSDKRSSTGLTDAVEWDGYSLFVKGQRLFLWSGEIHPWRLPVPALWLDVLQKIKAAGFNSISMYTHWGLINPSRDVFDTDGFRAIQPFIDLCQQVGLWVIFRPGPYINAEVSAGGIPGWVTALNASIRVDDPVWNAAYKPYWDRMAAIAAKNEVDAGGPIILVQVENEYVIDSKGRVDGKYIADLQRGMRDAGYKGPIFHNDLGKARRLLDGEGAVDIYAYDSYPLGGDCSAVDDWRDGVDTGYLSFFDDTAGKKGQPYFIPEFEAGWFVGWNLSSATACRRKFGREFERVYYLHNLASGMKLVNYYMAFGGTNWGQMAFPGTITSYDYGAPIGEDRQLAEPKYSEFKLLSHFIRAAPSLVHTRVVTASTTKYSDNRKVLVTELRNPENEAGFYILRQNDSTSYDKQDVRLKVRTVAGEKTIPHLMGSISLDGRDSRVVVTDFAFGSTHLRYCTASIFAATTVGKRDILVVYADEKQHWEIALPHRAKLNHLSGNRLRTHYSRQSRSTILNGRVSAGVSAHVIRIKGRDLLLLIVDTVTAYSGWQPLLAGNSKTYANFYGYGTNTSAIAFGPYLVRSARVDGSTLHLTGDLNGTTTLQVLPVPGVKQLTWNGRSEHSRQNAWGGLEAELKVEIPKIRMPELSHWRYIDSLPELRADFDDSDWVVADKTSTVNSFQPYEGESVLYAQDYGFHQGNIILRGTFEATGEESSLDISLSPGEAGAGAVFLNGALIGRGQVEAVSGFNDVNLTLHIPAGAVKQGETSALVVIVDHMGYEQTSSITDTPNDVQAPRGVRGYKLYGGGEIAWKIQGNAGGEDYPDKVRSIINTGGLYTERKGYHLEGIQDSDWANRSIADGIPGPGVGFFRTTFDLDLPAGFDVPISLVYPENTGWFRSQFYVNGWMMGKRAGDMGPQTKFPIPPGILRNGTNTLAVSLWALDPTGLRLGEAGQGLRLEVDGVIATSLDMASVRESLQ